jgi:hypothetical protein|tara:strand:- start:159 stop:425 length:267 start_codon:yes stop_codon:yes gene_type:complete
MGTYRDFSVQQAVTPGASVVNITNNNTTNDECRAVYIGASGNYEFYVNGEWVKFVGLNAGSILPIRATGARHSSDDSAPDAADINFLY